MARFTETHRGKKADLSAKLAPPYLFFPFDENPAFRE